MPEAYQGASPNSRFLAGSVPVVETSWQSYLQRLTGSVVTHLAAFALVLYVATRLPVLAPTEGKTPMPDITWIATPGPGGGGGGGGNRTPEPPRKAEIVPPKARPTVAPPPPKPAVAPKPLPQMNIPAVTAVAELPGAMSQLPEASPVAQGSGTGGGGGTGTGTGVGAGTGSGYGEGIGGGTGGGVYREGNGVTSPRLIREVKPNYTSEAMRARVQGIVTLEAVVNADGSVGNVQVLKSLDSTFGLDKEAVRTVKLWRFEPGRRLGQPVAVMVQIEMSFTLR